MESMDIMLAIQTKGKIEFALDQLRAGSTAVRYGHEMSKDDERTFNACRQYARQLLSKDLESNVEDSELIGGLTQLLANYTLPEPKS